MQITAGPEDITKLGLQCVHCGMTIMIRSNNQWAFPAACPICNVSWQGDTSETHRRFAEALRSVFDPGQSPVTIKMVFNGEDAQNPAVHSPKSS